MNARYYVRPRGSEKSELERLEGKDSREKLERLNDLKEKGAISKEEFEDKKQDLFEDL